MSGFLRLVQSGAPESRVPRSLWAEQEAAAELTALTRRQDATLTFHEKRGGGHRKISLLLPNGSRIIGLPADERTIRGFSNVALLLIDEAAQVSQGVYDTVRPVMAVSRGEMWLMSTPHGRQGLLFRRMAPGGAGVDADRGAGDGMSVSGYA